MQRYVLILQLILLILLQALLIVKCENNRKSVQIDNSSFLIEPNPKYTWNEAEVECKKERATLISPLGAYDYQHLHNYIKHNFENYLSFWTKAQVKMPSFFAKIGLQNQKISEQKCNYFEGTTFKYLPDACEKKLGFICEKPLKKDFYTFTYTCQQDHAKCDDFRMSLTYDEFAKNIVLQINISTHYGTTPRFWLGDNENFGYNCAASHRNEKVNVRTKFGFICEKMIINAAMSNQQLVLVILVTVVGVFGIILLCFLKCYFRKVKSHADLTDIPEPLLRNCVISI